MVYLHYSVKMEFLFGIACNVGTSPIQIQDHYKIYFPALFCPDLYFHLHFYITNWSFYSCVLSY